MKRRISHFLLTLFTVLILCPLCLYASGKTASIAEENPLVTSYKAELEAYRQQYDELCAKLEISCKKDDYKAYAEAKKELGSLLYPLLSESDSKAIADSLTESDTETAAWLFQNSRYYRPVLTLSSENYRSRVTVAPGTSLVLPSLKSYDRTKIFAGWAAEEGGEVLYEAGATVSMPVADTVLYAVFTDDPDLVQGPSILITTESETPTLQSGKQQYLSLNLKNNGTENLSDLKVSFKSDDPLFVILTDTLSCRSFPSGSNAVAKYRVITKAAAGTELAGTLTVTDSSGNEFKKDIKVTVE